MVVQLLLVMLIFWWHSEIHYRDDEFLAKFQKDIQGQPHIEKPVLYLIARCPETDQQLLYSSLRLTDIFELKEDLSTSNELILTDKLRFLRVFLLQGSLRPAKKGW